MSQTHSPSAKKRYGLARVCRTWEIPRSTVYAHRSRRLSSLGPTSLRRRRGPEGACTAAELVEAIRQVLVESPWHGEGYRKVWARLRGLKHIRTSKARVLRLMRENDLLAPSRAGRAHGPKAHDRSIIPERPNVLWGTDATSNLTREGNATIFFVIDHCTAECLGIHAARRGTRFEALEPLRQALGARGWLYDERAVGPGLALRHDHGSAFVSDVFQEELRFLGIDSSPSFVGEPEGNGCSERFVRTLKEQLLWLRQFETVEELRLALLEFKDQYNREWLIERHGHRSPSARYAELAA